MEGQCFCEYANEYANATVDEYANAIVDEYGNAEESGPQKIHGLCLEHQSCDILNLPDAIVMSVKAAAFVMASDFRSASLVVSGTIDICRFGNVSCEGCEEVSVFMDVNDNSEAIAELLAICQSRYAAYHWFKRICHSMAQHPLRDMQQHCEYALRWFVSANIDCLTFT